jgi:threonine aldolase
MLPNSSDTPDSPDSPDNPSIIRPQVAGVEALEELSQILKTVPDHQHHLIVDAARQAAALLASRPEETTSDAVTRKN